jgi:RNA polymerase sigma-70 factor (ECF subfamily)
MSQQVVEVVWNNLNTCLQQFIRRRVPDMATADDLLQDVYLKVHTRVDTLRDPDRLESWVYQIARNVINDYYRTQRPLDEITEMIPAPEADDADDPVIERLRVGVRQMIDLLPDEYREAILLTEYQGLTQQQMAQRLGISLPAAKSRVQRGKKMLREYLLLCCRFQFDRLGKVIDYHPRNPCTDPTC